eukprot:1053372-Pyramimonas_sp.AAC.1
MQSEKRSSKRLQGMPPEQLLVQAEAQRSPATPTGAPSPSYAAATAGYSPPAPTTSHAFTAPGRHPFPNGEPPATVITESGFA